MSDSVTQRMSEIDAELDEFDAVFAPGGHGPMVDLSDNPDVGRLLAALHRKRAPIAALCHGPAMLLSAPERADGQWLFDGYRMTSFTDEEEDQTEAGRLGMAWLLDTALKNAGAVFDDGPSAWISHVVVDRNLALGFAELQPGVCSLDEYLGVTIGHRPCARRFIPASTGTRFAAHVDKLRAPGKANHRHAEILACATDDLEPQSR